MFLLIQRGRHGAAIVDLANPRLVPLPVPDSSRVGQTKSSACVRSSRPRFTQVGSKSCAFMSSSLFRVVGCEARLFYQTSIFAMSV